MQNLPSNLIDENPMVAGDLANKSFNVALLTARHWRSFVESVICDQMYATAHDLPLKDLHENPNARARKIGGVEPVCTYITTATLDDVTAIYGRIAAIVTLAGRASVLPHGDAIIEKLHKPMAAALSRMRSMDPALWAVFTDKGKQYLTGPERAMLDIDGFTWTASVKGQSTHARYDKTADQYIGANRSMHAYVTTGAYVSERDILATL